MRTYGLIGYPLSHSFSQKYFTQKFQNEGIRDAVFENFSIPRITDLAEILQTQQNLLGFGITIPYKKAVLDYLTETDTAVKIIGACNSVKVRGSHLTGYNTDVIGFEQSFTPLLKPNHTGALILGTGGAALAVEYVLNNLGIRHQYVSRATDNDKYLPYSKIDEDILEMFPIIINCTPLGTYPNDDTFPCIPYHLLNETNYLFDLVYNPALTIFLKEGAARGATIKNGYDMLVGQAEASWKIWNE